MKPKLLLIILFWMIASPAFPQTSERLPVAPVRIGLVDLYPTIALTNLGVDNNVFNEPNQAAPKRDFTVTVTPAIDVRMRLGRLRLTGTLEEDLVYYRTYASERSANSDLRTGLQVQLMADMHTAKVMNGLPEGQSYEELERGYNNFMKEWESKVGGPQKQAIPLVK